MAKQFWIVRIKDDVGISHDREEEASVVFEDKVEAYKLAAEEVVQALKSELDLHSREGEEAEQIKEVVAAAESGNLEDLVWAVWEYGNMDNDEGFETHVAVEEGFGPA